MHWEVVASLVLVTVSFVPAAGSQVPGPFEPSVTECRDASIHEACQSLEPGGSAGNEAWTRIDEVPGQGSTIAVDEATMMVGSPFPGQVEVFEASEDGWTKTSNLRRPSFLSNESQFGESIAIDGNTAVVGASGVGSDPGVALVYERGADGWQLSQALRPASAIPGDHIGGHVALDGDRIVVSDPWQGKESPDLPAAYVFENTDGAFEQTARLLPSDLDEAPALPVAIDGQRAFVLDDPDGRLEVFNTSKSDEAPLRVLELQESSRPASLDAIGDVAVVGLPGSDRVHVFDLSQETRGPTATLTPPDEAEAFGHDVALADPSMLVVGDPSIGDDAGAGYVYERGPDGWRLADELVPRDADPRDRFGFGVAAANSTTPRAFLAAPLDVNPQGTEGSVAVFGPCRPASPVSRNVHEGTMAAEDLSPQAPENPDGPSVSDRVHERNCQRVAEIEDPNRSTRVAGETACFNGAGSAACEGEVALAGTGSAQCAGGPTPIPSCAAASATGPTQGAVAASGTDDANGRFAAASGTGDANAQTVAASGDGRASGSVAVSVFGCAQGTIAVDGFCARGPQTPFGTVDVRPTGDASGSFLAVSGTGQARCEAAATAGEPTCLAFSAGNDATCQQRSGCTAVSGTGQARCEEQRIIVPSCTAVSGTGPARGPIAVSGTQDAIGVVAISGTGDARSTTIGIAASGTGNASSSNGAAISGTGEADGRLAEASGTRCEDEPAHPPIEVTEHEGENGFVRAHAPVTGQPLYRPGSGVTSGNGTAEDPYVIEKLCVSAARDVPAVRIANTQAHVVVRNNTITRNPATQVTMAPGVVVENAANVTVEQNAIRHHGNGVSLDGVEQVNVTSNQLQDLRDDGIALWAGSGNRIAGNVVTETGSSGILVADGGNRLEANVVREVPRVGGIALVGANPTTLVDNQLHGAGLVVNGETAKEFDHRVGPSNTVNGEPIRYVHGQADARISGPAGQVIVVDTDELHVNGVSVGNAKTGIRLVQTDQATVSNVLVENARRGLEAKNSNVEIRDTRVRDANVGLWLKQDRASRVTNASVSNVGDAIVIEDAARTQVRDTALLNTTRGLVIDTSVEIQADDLHIESGENSEIGAQVEDSSRVDLTNVTVEGRSLGVFRPALHVASSDHVTIADANLSRVETGIGIGDADDVSVQNASILRGDGGIVGHDANDVELRGIDVADGYGPAVDLAAVTDARLVDNELSTSREGLTVRDSANVEILENTMTGNEAAGIHVVGTEAVRVASNQVVGNDQRGIHIDEADSGGRFSTLHLEGNDVIDNGYTGIEVIGDGMRAVANTLRGNDGPGLDVQGDHANLQTNVVEDQNGTGIVLDGWMAEVEDNRVSGNDAGLRVTGDRAEIVSNTIEDNRGDGLVLDVERFGRDVDRSENATVRSNRVSGNAGNGILMDRARNAVVELNEVRSNSAGVWIHTGSGHEMHGNNIVGHAIAGLRAVNVTETLDARHNWWGCQDGPGASDCDDVYGNVAFDPWLSEPYPPAGPS